MTAARVGQPKPAKERRSTPASVGRRRWGALAAALWACGCRCEPEDRKPYTPFGIASVLEPQAAVPAGGEDAGARPDAPFSPQADTQLDTPAAEFTFERQKWTSPEGMKFARVLPLAAAGRGTRHALAAWLVPADSRPDVHGALWYFPPDAEAPARLLKPFPAFIPTGEGCTQSVRLAATGSQTLSLDVESNCQQNLVARTPTRSLSVLAPDRKTPQLLELRLAPALPGEELRVTVDSQDQDGDARDDALIQFSLNTANTKPVGVRFTWLDRAAGLARDPEEPRKSFTDVGSVEFVRAKGANTSQQVLGRIHNARRLFAYLCQEGGSPRVTDENASPLSCGSLGAAFDWYLQAEVRAALTQKNAADALFALGRRDWSNPPVSEKRSRELVAEVAKALVQQPFNVQELHVAVRDPGSGPHYSPLTFQGNDLLVLTAEGVVRARGEAVEDASDMFDPWPVMVFGPSSERLTDVIYPCDAPTVRLASQSAAGNLVDVLDSEILAPRPGNCQGARPFWKPELRPIGWSPQGLNVLLGPRRLGPAVSGPHAGAPVSPDGSSSVSVTPLGLFVTAPGRDFLLATPSAELADCVVSNGAARIACRAGKSVRVFSVQ